MADLSEGNLDIIECGFLKDVEYEPGRTYFPQPSCAEEFIPKEKNGRTYAALVDYGRYDFTKLEPCSGKSFDYIRLSLFEKDAGEIEQACREILERGYRLSIQPMDTYAYTKEDLSKVLAIANRVHPETVSIVDTYSWADTAAVERVYRFYEEHLDPGIKIGFHTHNNRMNAVELVHKLLDIRAPERNVILDCSLFGMGRGGGNLNTELITEELNRNAGAAYQMEPILNAIDRQMLSLKERYVWGYSMPMLFAGFNGSHVHISEYLEKKPGMTSYDLRCILSMLDEKKKKRYDYDYVDTVYDEYMRRKEKAK